MKVPFGSNDRTANYPPVRFCAGFLFSSRCSEAVSTFLFFTSSRPRHEELARIIHEEL